jgi:hypothetical protein
MKTKNTARLLTITEPERLEVAKSIIIDERRKAKDRASYELYGITYGKNRLKVELIDDAPTSGDFAPLITKSRIRELAETWCMVVEFRGAWKSDDEAKVVAYETEARAKENE